MDEMRLYDRVSPTTEQSSGLFDRLNVSFMRFINAHDDLERLLIYLWMTLSQHGNQLDGNLVMADSLQGDLVF
jgi:hypothetical protein